LKIDYGKSTAATLNFPAVYHTPTIKKVMPQMKLRLTGIASLSFLAGAFETLQNKSRTISEKRKSIKKTSFQPSINIPQNVTNDYPCVVEERRHGRVNRAHHYSCCN
jgi:hypothetical protein